MAEERKIDISRPILAVVGYVLDAADPELRTLELAQRFFERRVGQRGATEEEVCCTLVWLAGTRVQLHNSKGAMHTLAHLRARSRGRYRDIENWASILEVLLHYEMKESRQGMARLEMLRIDSEDPRTRARLQAFQHQLRGRFMSGGGQLREAYEEYEKGINALRVGAAQLEDLAISAELYNDQGQALYRAGKIEDGVRIYSQAETVAKHINFPLALARSLRGRGQIYLSRKDFPEATKYLKAALDVYQRHDAPYGILRSSISLGRAYYGGADLREALFYFEEARLQCGKGRYPVEEAEVNARIGDVMLSEGQYEKAAECYESDLQLASVHGDERSRSHALRNVGRIQRLLGNFGRAEACLLESSGLLTKLGDRSGLSLTLQQIVQCYLEEGKTKEAREALDQLTANAQQLNRPHEMGVAKMLEGIVLRHEGRSEAARNQLERSLDVLGREPGFFTVLCQVELAQALFDLGDKSDSIHQFKEAIQAARRFKHHDMEKRALDLLSKVDRSEWARVVSSTGPVGAHVNQISRNILAIVALEIRGTGWLWTQEPEKVAALLNGFYEMMSQTIARQKGVLNKIVGHRMVAVYGLDSSCDPEQALRCAEACHAAFAKLEQENPAYQKLGLAAGVATGQGVHGMLGSADHKEYSIVGEPIELIDRLLSEASAAEIWVDSDTYRALRSTELPATPRDLPERGGEEKVAAYMYHVARPAAPAAPKKRF